MSFQLNKAYNRESFLEFLSDKFLPEDFRPKRNVEEIELSSNQNFATRAFRLGECRSLELEVFEIHHSSLNDARVGIAKDAFQLLLHHSFCNRALVAFVPEGSKRWRFSLIQIEAELNEHHRITRGYSNPRRYSFLLGEDTATKTPTQFLIEKGRICQRAENGKSLLPWEDLIYRFSIEALTKDFYNKLYNWYLWAIDRRSGVTFPNKIETDKDDRENIQIKIIRLITRMLFVWFIKQKHLVPPSLFDVSFLKTILRDFKECDKSNGDYYNAILQNLFFATLNQEIEDRKLFTTYKGRSVYYTNKQLYRDTDKSYFTFPMEKREEQIIALFKDVPYLNGGLFECLDKYELDENNEIKQATNYDGFSHENTKSPNGNFKKKAFIPNALFFAEEHEETVTIKEATDTTAEETQVIRVMGLLELFKQYNFTVEENTTSDKEVSLDPELLGRVFENLLAAYNPETQESARKSTGSFYTPREIVDYMVEESLIAYLSGECGHDADEMWHLIRDEKKPQIANPEQIIADLKRVKILDPACGSGAFPMGVLLKIAEIIEYLTPQGQFNRYQTKLDIIKNCIYGIDIQAIAMLICKLRFFISLICDCEKDETKPNFGIIPLPNLETKFVAANTLLSARVKAFDNDWTRDEELQKLQKELLDLRLGIFDLRTHEAKKNNKLHDREKCLEIEAYIKHNTAQPDAEKIAQWNKVIADCEAELHKYKEDYWVDEMVTQTSLFDTGEPTIFRRNINKEKRDELNARIRTAKADIARELNKTALPGFTKAVEQVTHWNPYDQNQVADFFDPVWMFNVSDGFDIVIGNPPYIQLQKSTGQKGKDKKGKEYDIKFADLYVDCNFETFDRTGDIYCLFYERGHQLLHKGGHLCYITSNKWMRAAYGETTRQYFATKTDPKLLIDFAGVKIFESATVDTNILLVENAVNKQHTICAVASGKDKDSVRELSDFVQQHHTISAFTTSDSWVILSEIGQSIKNKIEALGTPLKDWDIQINYGIKTGFNDAFIISTEKRDELLARCKDEAERKRTADMIRPILRGKDIKRYGYVWAGLWLINTHNGVRGKYAPIDINDYPTIKQHLDSYWEKICARDDKGVTPYNLRNCAYMDEFNKPKIIYPNMTKYMPFVWDTKQFITNQKCFIITGSNTAFLTAFFNSSLFKYCFRDSFPELQGGTRELSKVFFDKIPVIQPDEKTEKMFKDLVDDIQREYTVEKAKYIDKLVFDMYNLTEQERKLIGYIEIK